MPTILVVDDSPSIRMTLAAALRYHSTQGEEAQAAAKVVESGGKEDALRRLSERAFDLVFLDLNLGRSEEDGLEVLAAIRERSPQTRVVVMTGRSRDHPAVAAAMQGGADKCLEKPVGMEEIGRLLRSLEVVQRSAGHEP